MDKHQAEIYRRTVANQFWILVGCVLMFIACVFAMGCSTVAGLARDIDAGARGVAGALANDPD